MDGRAVTRGVITRQASLAGMAVAEARHPSGFELPLHAHPIACATLVVDGTFEERVDGQTYRCRAGDVILKPADAAHANQYGETGAVSFVLTFAIRATTALSDEAGSLARVQLLRGTPATAAMKRVRRATQRNEPDVSTEVAELALQLLRLAGGGGEPAGIAGDGHGPPPPWIAQARDRLHDEFRSPPSIAELADDAGVHPQHVSRSFRAHLGWTITEYVRRLRVEHAAAAIRSGGGPLSTVALEAGFSDQSHMTRQFRRYLGVTPGALQRG